MRFELPFGVRLDAARDLFFPNGEGGGIGNVQLIEQLIQKLEFFVIGKQPCAFGQVTNILGHAMYLNLEAFSIVRTSIPGKPRLPRCVPSLSAGLLLADALTLLLLRAELAQRLRLDEFTEAAAGIESVERLRTGLLHLHLETGDPVLELHAGCGFVYLLPTGSAGGDKGLIQVFLAQAAGGHAVEEFLFFRGCYAKLGHA